MLKSILLTALLLISSSSAFAVERVTVVCCETDVPVLPIVLPKDHAPEIDVDVVDLDGKHSVLLRLTKTSSGIDIRAFGHSTDFYSASAKIGERGRVASTLSMLGGEAYSLQLSGEVMLYRIPLFWDGSRHRMTLSPVFAGYLETRATPGPKQRELPSDEPVPFQLHSGWIAPIAGGIRTESIVGRRNPRALEISALAGIQHEFMTDKRPGTRGSWRIRIAYYPFR